MKRKEEIVTQAVKEQSQLYQPLEWRAGFISGANWADRTMLDRACEWLNKILYIHTEIEEDKDWGETNPTNWVTSDYDTVGEFIAAFRLAMEGGAE